MHLPSTFKALLWCFVYLFWHTTITYAQGPITKTVYKDYDRDGFGDSTKPKSTNNPIQGYVDNKLDCNDMDKRINPSAKEIKDGKDNDCDGMVDESVFYEDKDKDGFGSAISKQALSLPGGYATRSGDCDDAYNQTYPGALETCDSKDNDCDGQIDEGVKATFYADADGDGYGNKDITTQACSTPSGYVATSTDTDDSDKNTYPGAPEICDGKDNNNNGQTDEGVTITYYVDADGDRHGSGAAIAGCSLPAGHSLSNDDCNDNDNTVYPNAPDVCDGKDNNCDGSVDDGADRIAYYADFDSDGFGDPNVSQLACTAVRGYVTNNQDFDDKEATRYPNAPELCDGKDNNNNGQTDEGVTTTYYKDSDGDGFGNSLDIVQACQKPTSHADTGGDDNDSDNTVYPGAPEICDNRDNDQDGQVDEGVKTIFYADTDQDGFGNPDTSVQDCTAPDGYVANKTDADDSDNTIYPGATEICDNKDNDQDSMVDEGLSTSTYYQDVDGDGFGTGNGQREACSMEVLPTLANGGKWVTQNGDNNDSDNTMYPGASELCDGKDNDQDGTADDGLVVTTYYSDMDGDRFGGTNSVASCSASTLPYILGNTWVTNGGDANDSDNTVYPGAPERCDGKDNDQDGQIDEGINLDTYYRDADGDGYGTSSTIMACTISKPDGYARVSGDCNDNDDSVYPGAPERCDGRDNDCDGSVDEGVSPRTWYRDADGDNYGTSRTIVACSQPDGYGRFSGDCNDNDADINPGAFERCDGKDNDCDGSTDESGGRPWPRDADGDGWGNSEITVLACSQPAGYAARSGDCNDNDANVNPLAVEICDGKDNDCDGAVDEGCTVAAARMNVSAKSDQALRPVSTLSPNPTVDELTIELSRPVSKLKSVKVSSVIEQTVLVNDYAVAEGDKIKMRVSPLKPGLYIIRIDFGDGYETLKFIKN